MDSNVNTTSAPVDTQVPVTNEVVEAQVDESAEGSDEGSVEEVAATPKEAAVEEAKRKKLLKIKVDGREEDVELDLDNEEELKKHLQLSKVAQKRMQQFNEYEKGMRNFLEALRQDPIKVLSDPRLGISPEQRQQLAEMIINEQLEDMQKSPEQKEKERLQKEYEDLKKQVEAEKQAREQAEFARLQEQQATILDNDITEALDQAKLPKNARTVKYMAQALMVCLQNDLDLSAKDLVPYVQKEILKDFRDIISALPDGELEEWLGKDQLSRVRKRSLQRIKQAAVTPSDIKPTGQSEQNKQQQAEQPKKIHMKDFFKSVGKW